MKGENYNGNGIVKVTQIIDLTGILSQLSKVEREKILSGYDIKNFARVFADDDVMNTIDSFLGGGMNVSKTASRLYMHRNTLTYRLNKIKKLTGLDLREFDQAVTFEIIRTLYKMK